MDPTSLPALGAAALWTGLNLALMLLLGLNVTRLRLKLNVGVGSGGNAELERAVRAHGNNTEYVPGLLLGLALLALLGTSVTQIHIIGGVLFLARLLHAHGIQVLSDGLPPTRASGNVITWGLYAWVAIALASKALA